jgi:alpha-mannosidase
MHCPHTATLCPLEITRSATEFNQPLRICSVPATSRGTARERSYFEITVGDVILDAVKPAETDLDHPHQPTDDVILRLFDPTGRGGPATVRVGDSFARAGEADLLERPRAPVPLRDGQLELEFRAYEVKTVRLQRG